MYYYTTFVLGKINPDHIVTTTVAKTILKDINAYYDNKKVVLISNREINHRMDLSIYKLVNPKKIIGIAIVSKEQNSVAQAIKEQKLYHGSFGLFKNMSSAIAWAQLLVAQHK